MRMDIFSTDKSPTEIRDHHSKRTLTTMLGDVKVESSVDPMDVISVLTENSKSTSPRIPSNEIFSVEHLEEEQAVTMGPSDAVAGDVGHTSSRNPTEISSTVGSTIGTTDLERKSTEKPIFEILIGNLDNAESANIGNDAPQPE